MKTNDARGGRVGSPAAHIPTHIKTLHHMVCIMMSSPEMSHDFIASKLNKSSSLHIVPNCVHLEQQLVHSDRAQKSGLHGSYETFIGLYEHTHVMHSYCVEKVS